MTVTKNLPADPLQWTKKCLHASVKRAGFCHVD